LEGNWISPKQGVSLKKKKIDITPLSCGLFCVFYVNVKQVHVFAKVWLYLDSCGTLQMYRFLLQASSILNIAIVA
jgi:hypothetical protein